KFQDAYSFDAYGESGWRGAITALVNMGLNDLQIEAFMRSKHTRWAGDSDEKRKYGHYNGNTIREYMKSQAMDWKKEMKYLVEGTFF
ncbi:MAG: hypothetical protein ACWGQW_09060, partial [bacterium]